MKKETEIKDMVREKYAAIAAQDADQNRASCCGAGGCSDTTYTIFSEDYTTLNGYVADADLGLGCGLPTEFAKMKEGDTVIDLGSGAGNDCFVARAVVGERGKVIGIDMTEAMIEKARTNAEKLGYKNVEFRLGEIEDMPIGGNRADVVVSNCVLNLVPDKLQAFREVYRVLKPGGHFSISDVVLRGELPENIRKAGEMYAGCVAGAMQIEDYLNVISKSGFTGITVQKERAITIPDDILSEYLSSAELEEFKSQGAGIFSITVYAEKPVEESCCTPGNGCC